MLQNSFILGTNICRKLIFLVFFFTFFVYKYLVTPDFFCVKLFFGLPFQVHPKDVNKFQQAYSSMLKGNLDGLKKLKKTKTKAKATQ